MEDEIKYVDKAGIMLDCLKIGEIFDIDKNVKTETRADFIEVIKSYIDRRLGHLEGWGIEFNGSFEDGPLPTKLRKIRIR